MLKSFLFLNHIMKKYEMEIKKEAPYLTRTKIFKK